MQRKVYGGFCSGLGFPGVFLAGSEDDNASEMGRIGGPGSEGLDLEAAKKCCGYAIKNSDDVHEASVGVGNLRCRENLVCVFKEIYDAFPRDFLLKTISHNSYLLSRPTCTMHSIRGLLHMIVQCRGERGGRKS